MKITIDFETRSEIDLKKCGIYRYAEDASTDILCLAVKVEDKDPYLYVPEKFLHLCDRLTILDDYLENLIHSADLITAHNMTFESTIWHHVMHKRYGFRDLPKNKLRCSAALAAAYALPRSLAEACKALELSEKKDKIGYRVMMKMCKPRRPTKKDPSKWHENSQDFNILCDYCKQDVEAEHELAKALHPLSQQEQDLWQLDQTINQRGVKIDIDAVKNLKDKIVWKEKRLLFEIQGLTKGYITSPRQVAESIKWLKKAGVNVRDLQKETVRTHLKKEYAPNIKRFLEIRQSLSKSSTAKLDAMLAMICSDGRVKGTMLYNGASTGRWAGRGLQVHNLPRNSFEEDEIESVLDNGVSEVEGEYGCVFDAVSRSLRGMITAEKGHSLFVGDFVSIEAMILAWLAEEEKTLNAFRQNLDLYKITAEKIYGVGYKDIDKNQRTIGKVAMLALGYQGWVGAFQSMASAYGVELSDEKAADIAKAWRNNNPKIVKFWRSIENEFSRVIREGECRAMGRIQLGIRGSFLHMRLPSGRLLAYYSPFTREIKDKYGRDKNAIFFNGVDLGKWQLLQTYGGKLTENIVQAIARDLLAEAIIRLEENGFKVIMHVHDEIICEVIRGNLNEFEDIMSIAPTWAKGLPIKVESYEAKRYRKN